ncbi:MAG: cupredoxin domain-containing protein [Ketobacteraceae bacterium]|nr:cupredoxin domain-containing protein [Ketobacteraceae bacterium]
MNASKFLVVVASMSMSAMTFAAGAHGGGHGNGAASGEPGKVSEANRTITVEMYDNYYEPEKIEVKPGETVRFVVENKGNLVHEFNIGTPAMHEGHQKEMQMMVEHGVIQGGKLNKKMMEMDMDNGQSMKHDDPSSVLLEPGQSKEVVWKFTEKSNIEFACNVPGHYQSGMYGEVNFK